MPKAGASARRADAQHVAWRDDLRTRLGGVVDLLVPEFGVQRILLFGSLARDEAQPGSDVDILVHGLGLERLIEATALAGRILGDAEVDLVAAQIARLEILTRAENEGQVLYAGDR